MLNRKMRVAGVAALCASALGGQKASPTRPSGVDTASADAASVTDARTGATIIAARASSPASGAQISWVAQPISLTVTNAVTTGSSALTYNFEVSTDAAFGKLTQSKTGVVAGAGTTKVALDKLAGSTTYYWRVQANPPNGTGPYSSVRSFVVGPEIILGTPAVVSPANGENSFTPTRLTAQKIARSGPVGDLTYSFQIASDSNFADVLYAQDIVEIGGPDGRTGVTANNLALVGGRTYFWRFKVTDTKNGISTAYSSPATFVAQTFNFATATMWDNPKDVGSWPETSRITSIKFTGSAMEVDFDRREGANRWPDVTPPGWNGDLQYTLGMCRNVAGGWHCSAVVQFWYGRALDSTAPPSRFWREWWYDSLRWGPLASNPPQEGEMVGVFVGSGDLRGRDFSRASCPRVCERTNVVFVPFTSGGASYSY